MYELQNARADELRVPWKCESTALSTRQARALKFGSGAASGVPLTKGVVAMIARTAIDRIALNIFHGCSLKRYVLAMCF